MIQLRTYRLVLLFATFSAAAAADDWPQILGPNRNGVSDGETLLEKWPEDGPRQLWRRECGEGYAGVAVKNNKVYLYHRVEKSNFVECLNAADGALVWKTKLKAAFQGGASSNRGPRCVPLVHDDSLYCMNAVGTLRKLNLEDGKELWVKPLFKLYKAGLGYFGAGCTPIIVDDTIIVIVGGKEAGIVGLDLDGNEKWTTEPDTASYSAPVALKFQNKSCVACVSKYHLRMIEVSSGKVLVEQEFGERGPTVNAATPLVFEDKIFLTAAYRIGSRMISLKTMETLWENDESMSSQYTTSVPHQGHLYGSAGREDFANGNLRCVRASDGKVLWSSKDAGICHVIKVNDLGLAWNVKGRLQLFRLSPNKFELLGESQVFETNAKPLPALSNGRIFLKTNGDIKQGELVCLQVGPK